MAQKIKKQLYIGVILIAFGVIFLTYILTTGPYDKIQESTTTVLYDHPVLIFSNDIEPGDKLILNFESTEPINMIIIRKKDSGAYFNLEDRSVEHIILASESTSGSFEYEFNKSGKWNVYFENPAPPPRNEKPKITYWGEFIEKNKDLSMHYTNIATSIILIILGLVFLYSYHRKKQPSQKQKKKGKKKKGQK